MSGPWTTNHLRSSSFSLTPARLITTSNWMTCFQEPLQHVPDTNVDAKCVLIQLTSLWLDLHAHHLRNKERHGARSSANHSILSSMQQAASSKLRAASRALQKGPPHLSSCVVSSRSGSQILFRTSDSSKCEPNGPHPRQKRSQNPRSKSLKQSQGSRHSLFLSPSDASLLLLLCVYSATSALASESAQNMMTRASRLDIAE